MKSWNDMKKRLEEDFLAPSLRGRVSYFMTRYTHAHDEAGRIAVRVDGKEVLRGFDLQWDWNTALFKEETHRRFPEISNREEFWQRVWDVSVDMGAITTGDLYDAFDTFENQSIEQSLDGRNGLIRLFAVLDRRVGKRRLQALWDTGWGRDPAWLLPFFCLRLEAEDMPLYAGLCTRAEKPPFCGSCGWLSHNTAKECCSTPEGELQLHIPTPEEAWFYIKLLSDPATMSYNAPWFPPDGCIPFTEADWAEWYPDWIGREPERFYAYLQRKSDGAFVGGVNFQHNPERDWWDMGILLYAPERGKGYGTQGLRLLLDRAFRVNGISRLHNDVETTRDAAYHIHKAVGFRDAGKEDGIIHLLLTKEEYFG